MINRVRTSDGAAITIEAVTESDEQFLRALYAELRADDLRTLGLDDVAADTFLDMQWRARRSAYQQRGVAEFVVTIDGEPVGHLVEAATADEHRLVDIAVAQAHRQRGIARALVAQTVETARAAALPVRLTVARGNVAAISLYASLGFEAVGATELDFTMEWRPGGMRGLADRVRLAIEADAAGLETDASQFGADEWIPHFNTRCYEGDWSGIALRSVGGASGTLYPDPAARQPYADTALLARCPHVQAFLTRLKCPLLSVRFLRLGPSARVLEHSDLELGAADGEVRLHVPVTTNADVEFLLAGDRVDMDTGDVWYLDLNQEHAVTNNGATARIHLVVDCVVDDWLSELLISSASRQPRP
jgi:ribosomal protein S18 acetylase RimI-like enzyme